MKYESIELKRWYDKDANITYKVIFNDVCYVKSSAYFTKYGMNPTYVQEVHSVEFKTEYEASLFMDRVVRDIEKREAKQKIELANIRMTRTLRRYP